MASRFLAVSSALAALVFTTGCQTTGSTTPNTTEQIRPGIAGATALQNLARVRDLEEASGRTSTLADISGAGVDVDSGSVTAGNGWHYTFKETMPGGGVRHNDWRVSDTGAITVRVDIWPIRSASVDIGPFMTVDSREAVRLARIYGGQRYLDRYSGARVAMFSRFVHGVPYWDLKFWGSPPTERSCTVVIVINAQSGELVSGDTSCLDR